MDLFNIPAFQPETRPGGPSCRQAAAATATNSRPTTWCPLSVVLAGAAADAGPSVPLPGVAGGGRWLTCTDDLRVPPPTELWRRGRTGRGRQCTGGNRPKPGRVVRTEVGGPSSHHPRTINELSSRKWARYNSCLLVKSLPRWARYPGGLTAISHSLADAPASAQSIHGLPHNA